ncbi:M24 family metallopeptidase [Bacillus salitolerans]|uniref:M24 family metallopeptidase n=1 Tax=Bacillus salitolerans TaxID=1437434 RepID=A0ABW4LWZ5_9BACI
MFQIQKEKLSQVVTYLRNEHIDLWLILTSEGNDPCLPLVFGVETVGAGAFIVTSDGKKLALCSGIDAHDIEQSGLFDQVYKYSSGLQNTLLEVIKELKPQTIALNYSKEEHLADGLTAGRFRWLKKVIGNVFQGSYVSSAGFLSKLRAVKSTTEIEKIKKAINVTEDIYKVVFNELKAGMTEKEVGTIFVKEMESRGVMNGIDRTLSMPIVMKENIAHRAPSDVIIQPGDLLIMDFSVAIDGYVSDIARTVYFLKEGETKAPHDIQHAFNTVHEAISLAAEKMKPGVKGYEVDEIARNYYVSKGYPEIQHATGHQIGREVHDGGGLLGPRWKRYGNAPFAVIEEGNVYTIEPTIFLDNGIHFIVEENVVVTKDGIEYLTTRQDELILIG